MFNDSRNILEATDNTATKLGSVLMFAQHSYDLSQKYMIPSFLRKVVVVDIPDIIRKYFIFAADAFSSLAEKGFQKDALRSFLIGLQRRPISTALISSKSLLLISLPFHQIK